MLEIQKFLQGGKTLDDLSNELAIKTTHHPDLPIVILNYDQIESPKTNPLVREARGLVLNKNDWSLVARSFPRFFNWGEVPEEMDLFNFSDFVVESKEDGSLIVLYWFNDEWHINTRASFALDYMQNQSFTWREAVCRALDIQKLDRNLTYICEFVSPWNKIVRRYAEPQLYLLTAFNGLKELHYTDVDRAAVGIFKRPERYHFGKVSEIKDFLTEQSEADPTFEGVVICDDKKQRWKIKNPAYISLHRLRGEGDNLFNPKHLLPYVLKGEADELLVYFEEVTESFYELKNKVDKEFEALLKLWQQHKDIEDQKEFALTIKDKTPYSSVLFTTRKKFGNEQSASDLRLEFVAAERIILKRLTCDS
jgi:hypothetical protein